MFVIQLQNIFSKIYSRPFCRGDSSLAASTRREECMTSLPDVFGSLWVVVNFLRAELEVVHVELLLIAVKN